MARCVVLLGPVDHDGALYLEGEEVSLAGDAADALVSAGVVQLLPPAAKGKAAEPRS